VIARGHFGVAANLADIIQNPDEIWNFHTETGTKNKAYSYIKYFKNEVITVFATEVDGLIKAESCYKLVNEGTFDNLRKGILVRANKNH
jgi:phage-Barnase-EndoU-ColicinE5/D-RelE like nuclease2